MDRALRAQARARRAAVRRVAADLSRAPITQAGRSTRSTLETPLGSGAYKVGASRPAATSNIERVKDWWGADLPVARGQNNFDVVRYEYYRDRDVAFEGFTGKNYLFREEFTSRIWATRYDFPAIRDGRVKRARCARRHAVRARRAGSSIRGATKFKDRRCARR